ncbi:hypothetical protein GCM10010269_28080 [Streptomyces humidus]|uniref:Flp pilus assembly protein RcpC/CpaB domain-containing protein n=1 Tax=Streptomyces humidus TaxID=52259 RepID=A0A918FW88_9ACTN|nr:RcpC/CpaB family pilus assembly protein [Streptomyces humidus]GGR87335.1 hypothetical protein GCM10010269_28080 [Streptomyces humidus]
MSALPPSPPLVLPSAPCPPGAETPATCEVPVFDPVRVGHGRYRIGRLVRSRRRALAFGLAVTAAALVAASARDDPARGHPDGDVRGGSPSRARSSTHTPAPASRTAEKVTAPVRIADAATVRLLRPGDRVDVIAVEQAATGGTSGGRGDEARVVARGALVTKVPEPLDASASASALASGALGENGALVVLSVPRSTAARLAGASATGRLAVTLW